MIKNENLELDLFAEAEKQFKIHLSIPGNERIIFSGKFGHGKTTFLSEFFKDENQKQNFQRKKYNVIRLFPVNYSIASNEDIFKYIKYDIILEMLEKQYKVEEVYIDQLKTLPKYLHKNGYKILAAMLHMIPQVGKDLVELLDRSEELKDLISEYENFHKEAEEEKNETNGLIDFFDKLENQEGSIFEENVVSKTIEKILAQSNEDEENVLLIDDLDRIDPEHIFRILNVFAAHFDRRNKMHSKNKFGFDKVILVCDIENIRNIFAAKYGANTDFNGYIDKFYSYEIFCYSIRNAIQSFAQGMINNALWEWYNGDLMTRDNIEYYRVFFLQNSSFIQC